MTRYRITYLTGHDETVTAANVVKDIDEGQYRFTDGNGQDVALIPSGNVLSVILVEESKAVTS